MDKTILATIVVIVFVGLLIFGFLYFKKSEEFPGPAITSLEDVTENMEIINNAATGGVLPEIKTEVNPLENKPNINPVDKANPFKDIKTNPFR